MLTMIPFAAMCMSRRVMLVFVLWITAVFRLYGLSNLSPPGLEHDEVANWLISRAILDGQHAIYFTQAYGHEAGFHYLQAGFIALLGDNALALRLPAAFLGILLVAITYTLARKLFGKNVALMTMGLTAVHFYPIFYSRLALRAIALPMLSAISAYFWWQWWSRGASLRLQEQGSRGALTQLLNYPISQSPISNLLLSAIFAGLTIHTYMAARAVPIFYGLFCLYLAIFHWPQFKTRWRSILLFWLITLAIAAPLLIYLRTNPTSEFRITEIDSPLRALMAGNVRPVLENSLKIAGMFGFRGDPLWRQYVAEQPLFEPVVASLFYGGVLLALWRWRDGRYAFILLWSLASFAPSIVTVDAPSIIRTINILPIFILFPALVIHKSSELSPVIHKLSTRIRPFIPIFLTLLYTGWTAYSLFIVWPQNEEVQFVWQKALTETAFTLDTTPNSGPVAIGGWSPSTMDPPTMQLSLRRQDLDLRYFGSDSQTEPINTLILPYADADEGIRIFHPTVRPLALPLQAKLTQLGATQTQHDTFTQYTIRNTFPISRSEAAQSPISFNQEIQLLQTEFLPDGLLTTWQILASTDQPRHFFVHALSTDGNILAQHDGLDAPAIHWQPGDILWQYHPLPVLDTAVTHIRLGLYNPATCPACQNLSTEDGSEFLLIQP